MITTTRVASVPRYNAGYTPNAVVELLQQLRQYFCQNHGRAQCKCRPKGFNFVVMDLGGGTFSQN